MEVSQFLSPLSPPSIDLVLYPLSIDRSATRSSRPRRSLSPSKFSLSTNSSNSRTTSPQKQPLPPTTSPPPAPTKREMLSGKVVVERIGGRSTVSRCFSKYPLKFILPRKVGPSQTDVVWIYTLSYGGGIVSGDSIACDFTIGDGCTTVLTTQASTKVYKSVDSKCSEQTLEARIGRKSLLVVIPDPVTCFSTAKYSQRQVFKLAPDSSLLVVDWITSGRHESGEKWDFGLYKSTNQIFLEDGHPLFLDTILLEQGSITTVAERMQDYQVVAMLMILGPKLKHIQNQVQQNVKKMMSERLQVPSVALGRYTKTNSDNFYNKPPFIASCSVFGPQGIGVVVRIAATTTESVYRFLHHQLSSLEPLIGVPPYH